MTEEVPDVSLSVVSHRNGAMIDKLLGDLRCSINCSYELFLTINVPEDLSFLDKYSDMAITLIHNADQQGFGANHNAAFRLARAPSFIIINPDIRLRDFDFKELLRTRVAGNIAALSPAIKSPAGMAEDHARRHPTFASLCARFLTKWRNDRYPVGEGLTKVDWLAGMFVCFDRKAFATVGGFDEGYFMYLEDADLGRTLSEAGFASYVCARQSVIHDAQRASKRDTAHLKWHVSSAMRYFRKHGFF